MFLGDGDKLEWCILLICIFYVPIKRIMSTRLKHNYTTCHINADYPRILEWTKLTYFKITIIQYRYIKYRVELSITIVFNFSNSQKAKILLKMTLKVI